MRPTPARRRGVSPWPIVLVAVALAAIAAVVAFSIINGIPHWHLSSPGGGGGGSGGGTALKLSAVGAYDPFGTNGEHDSVAYRATDGNIGTYWYTESYNDAPSLGKPGVGLVLDAGSSVQLRSITVETQTPGFTAEIKAGGSTSDFPATVSPSQTVANSTTFTIGSGTYRYYEIWITRLGPPRHDAWINEVKATR